MIERTRRLRTAVGAMTATLAVIGLTVVSPTTATAATVFIADYEDGTPSSGAGIELNTCCPHSIGVTTSVPRLGNYALRSHLAYGDAPSEGGVRAESHTLDLRHTHFRAGDDVYYGFSVYLLSTWQHDTTEDIVFQWKPWPDACEADKAPSAFLTTTPSGKWRLRVNSDGNRCSTPGSIVKTSVDFADIQPGQWHDFMFHFRWRHGSDGLVEIRHQTSRNPGWQTVTKPGANTYNDDATTFGYLKWGIYKPAWNAGPTTVANRTIFHDNVAVGGSFAAVDPTVGH